MGRNLTGKYLAGVSLIAANMVALPAVAQDDNSVLEEIVVTATKRQTTLQDTPVAVSVTSEKTIEQTRILDMKDLQSVVPSLRVGQLQSSSNTNFIIRGFGNGANNPGIESSVGMFVDGVYRSRTMARIGDFPKVQRIEVLRGPQSTLFGKNASAGVVSVVTAEPSFDQEGYVEAGYGNYNNMTARAYLTGPISDTVAFSLGANYNKRDGYTDAYNSSLSDVNDRDRMGVRGQLLFTPSDETKVRIIADYSKLDEVCCSVLNLQNQGAAGIIAAQGGVFADDQDVFANVAYYDKDPVNDIEDFGISANVSHDFDSFNVTSITSYRGNDSLVDYDADFTTKQLLYTQVDVELKTFTQELRLTSTGADNTVDWMIGGFYFDDKVDSTEGLQWGPEMRPYWDQLIGGPDILLAMEYYNGFAPGTTFFGQGVGSTEYFTQDNTSKSLFGTLDFHVSEKFTITAGANYTKDKKTIVGSQSNLDPWFALDLDSAAGTDVLTNGQIASAWGDPTSAIYQAFQGAFGVPLTQATQTLIASGGAGALAQAGYNGVFFPTVQQGLISTLKTLQLIPPMVSLPNAVEDGRSSDSKLTWNLRATYEANDNWSMYLGAATGFKSSSWNLSRASAPTYTQGAALAAAGVLPAVYELGSSVLDSRNFGTRSAAPEKSEVYEIGVKARFDRGAFNVAIFDQTIKGFQSNLFVGNGFVLANAGEQSTKGVEFDATYVPVDALTLTFAATYLDALYDDFQNAPGVDDEVVDRSGTKPAGIPEWAITTSATYNFEVGDAAAFIRADYQYESNVLLVENIPAATGAEQPYRKVSTINASTGMSWESGLSVQLWARNLFNDKYLVSAFPGVLQPGVINGYRNQPRTFGINVRQTF